MCPVARCSPPRPGCSYDTKTYFNSEGTCCPALCKEVCEKGKYSIYYLYTAYNSPFPWYNLAIVALNILLVVIVQCSGYWDQSPWDICNRCRCQNGVFLNTCQRKGCAGKFSRIFYVILFAHSQEIIKHT